MNRPGALAFGVFRILWPREKVRRCLLWAALAVLIGAEDSFAWDSKLFGSLWLKEEYNDNIFLDVYGKRQSDFITTISPGLEWQEKSERLDFSAGGRVSAIEYLRYHEYDAVDYNAQGSLLYRLTPRLGVSAGGGFLHDSRPDRDLLVTGLVLGTVQRDRWFYNLSGNYALTEREGAEVNYFQSKDDFHSPRVSDSEVKNGNILFTRDLGDVFPLWKGRLSFNYGDYYFTTPKSTTKNYSLTIGASRDLTETWGVIADLGVRYTQSRLTVTQVRFIPPFFLALVQEEQETSDWGGVGGVSLTYRGDRNGADVGVRQDIEPSSGVGVTERTSFNLSMYHRITYELQATLAANYFFNKAGKNQYSQRETRFQSFYLSPGLRYEWSRDLAMEFSYSFTRTNDMIADTIGDRNLLLIRFTVQEDLLEALQRFLRWAKE